MIIKKLIEALTAMVTSALSNVGSLPDLPAGILTYFNQGLGYLLDGIDLLGMFIGSQAVSFMGVCLDIILVANAFYMAYSAVMWVLHKIPILSIK